MKPAEPEIAAEEPTEQEIVPQVESQEEIKEESIEAQEKDTEKDEKPVVENAEESEDPNVPGEPEETEKKEEEVKEILAELPRADPNDHVIPEQQEQQGKKIFKLHKFIRIRTGRFSTHSLLAGVGTWWFDYAVVSLRTVK